MIERDRSTDAAMERESITDILEDRELLVASNREPYIHSYEGDEVTVSKPAGGLTAVLDPIMQQLSGTWVAWGSGDADFDVTDDRGRVEVPPDDPSYTIQRIDLSDRQISGYYYGYSNQVLWPLCHGMPTRATFDAEFWDHYRQVNETFADALVACADDDDPVVWIHDYHLGLVPRLVRDRLPNAFLTQFWHIPWPSWETFRSCPQYRELLEGLLANDVIGFHNESYCESFCECVLAAFEDATVDENDRTITYDGHTTRVRSHPLGIDDERHAEYATQDEVEQFWSRFVADHRLGDRIAVGVDRLDYTKGILQRLDALERLWEHRPDRRGALTYVQKGSKSRTQIDEYQRLQDEVERRIDEINDRFATAEWEPIVYVDDHFSRAGLAALYRHADIALVSPLRDGMNLVAKEYVASQLDNDGVLVLSAFAGSVASLGEGALVVNPNDTVAFASAIEAALAIPEPTRRRRMRALRRRVHDEDTDAWVNAQFAGIEEDSEDAVGERPRWQSTPTSVWGRTQQLTDALRIADGLFVMTDFDGTVADIVDDPDRAEIRPDARNALETLAAHPWTKVAVVSGREVDDVRERVAVDGAYYAGNHGIQLHDGTDRSVHPDARQTADVLPDVCDAIERRFAEEDGVFVEEKGVAATVHYRQADSGGEQILAAVRTILAEHDEGDALRATRGKQVVELRPNVDWDKGEAVELLRERFVPDDEQWLTVYLGDDASDETAFEAIGDDGLTVAVGSDTDPTAAQYVVSDPSETTDFLRWVAGEGLASLDTARPEDTVVGPS